MALNCVGWLVETIGQMMDHKMLKKEIRELLVGHWKFQNS